MKLITALNTFITLIFISGFCAMDNSLLAQITFERYYDFGFTEEGYDVVASSDGGYVICGQQRLTIGESQIVLLKVDSLGNQQWVKFYGGPAENQSRSITRTFDNGYLIAGHTSSLDYKNFPYLIRTDSVGDTVWTTKSLTPIPIINPGDHGNGKCYDVIETRDSSIFTLSYATDYDTVNVTFLTKLNPTGDTLWTKKFRWGNLISPYIAQVVELNNGNLAICGRKTYTLTPTFTAGAFLSELNQNGDTLWTREYAFANFSAGALSLDQTSDLGYLLSGYVFWSSGNTDYFVVRTNQQGDTLWTKVIGGNANDGGYGIQTSGGDYFLAGQTFSYGAGSSDVYILKLDSLGSVVWQETYGGINYDYTHGLLQTQDGGFLLCGFETSFGNGNGNIYLIKTDSTGYAPTGLHPLAPKKDRLVVYPNPCDGEFTVDYTVQEKGILQLLNIYGVPVAEYEIPGYTNSITVQKNLPAGLYFCRVIVGGALVGCEKIMVK